MRKFCVYGKGGIGKSTMVSNIAVALAELSDEELNEINGEVENLFRENPGMAVCLMPYLDN